MDIYRVAFSIVKKLQDQGFITYFAGGWVRDFLMAHPSDDIDIATTATTDDIQNLFPKTIPVGINFGIIIVVEEGHQFEVATFRKEKGYEDGRRPTHVEPCSPEDDALRRDFTINGMFYDPIEERLYDFVGGKKDLSLQLIRAIGNPHERFFEDRLRMIRAVRYASRFHFTIDPKTIEAIEIHAPSLFPAVAIERVWHEFLKMSKFPHLEIALAWLHQLGLLQVIFPDLESVSLDEIKKRLALLPEFPEESPLIAQIALLFPDATLQQKLTLCDHFKLSNQERKFVEYLHTLEHQPFTDDDYTWAHLYADPLFPTAHAIQLVKAHKKSSLKKEHEKRKKKLSRAVERIQNRAPVITAQDLIKLGVEKGPRLGRLLKEAERISINDATEDKDKILKKLQAPNNQM